VAHEAGHGTDAVKRCGETELTEAELVMVVGGQKVREAADVDSSMTTASVG
jgi:hypothetical protein